MSLTAYIEISVISYLTAKCLGRFIPRESEAAAQGICRPAAEHLEHQSKKQRKTFESIAAEYALFVERRRQ